MDEGKLEEVAKNLAKPGKGLLAADESNHTCKKRFDSVDVECTPDTRQEYRGLLFTTPGAEEFLNGVILFDETFWQSTSEGQLFREYLINNDVMPGIKVDKGLIDLPGFEGEQVSQGHENLLDHMRDYAAAGAKFAKWRSVIAIGDSVPTDEAIGANAMMLALYARTCQEVGVVPIVEPEVLFEGTHSSQQCEDAMARTFDILFNTLQAYRVHLPGTVLKTSMVLPGKESGNEIDPEDVADRTLRVLYHHVPHELGGVVFLSGGQTSKDAMINLNRIAKRGPQPWGITFSYSRALQDPVLKAWAKNRDDPQKVQDIFHRQLSFAAKASKGELSESDLDGNDFVTRSQD